MPLQAAEPVYIDAIVAIVEDDVITNHELANEVDRIRREFNKQARRLPSKTTLNRQVLELMITKSILQQEASSRGIKITDTQLNSTLQNMARSNDMTLAEFRLALLETGIDYNRFRDNIRNELAVKRIQDSYARQNVDVSEQEINDLLFRSQPGAESLEFHLSHILMALPDGANSRQVLTARQKIEEIADRLEQGEEFSQLASSHSAGRNALQGGDLGWRKLAEIPSLFADIIPTMQIGETSQPLRSASGFHLVRLNQKRNSEQVLVHQIKARHILIKSDKVTSDNEAREKAEVLREKFLLGEDFAELAKAHSDDPGSGGLGGELGWVSADDMVPAFARVLKNTETGETSEVFRSRFGWHFIEVLGRQVVDETEESKRNNIRSQLLNQKKQEVLDLWQRRLRDQAFIKIFDA